MTWEELCEKCQEYGFKRNDTNNIVGYGLLFADYGSVYYSNAYDVSELAENRTYEQMYAIMKALWE